MPTSFDWLAIYSSVVATVALEPSLPAGCPVGRQNLIGAALS